MIVRGGIYLEPFGNPPGTAVAEEGAEGIDGDHGPGNIDTPFLVTDAPAPASHPSVGAEQKCLGIHRDLAFAAEDLFTCIVAAPTGCPQHHSSGWPRVRNRRRHTKRRESAVFESF